MATFFDSFSSREIARISAHGRRVKLPEGWSPIWERTPADKAYIILDGEVSVRRGGDEVARLGAGDIVGEAAIVGGSLRTASVVALTPLTAIHFTDTDINELIEEMPGFKDKLVEVVESRVGR
jgi:CRP/FNR family transcriptional regulator, cyclic AMP receptor protein